MIVENEVEQQGKANRDETIVTSSNTYQMKPHLDETFKASKVKEIIVNVLTETLQGKNYSTKNAGKWTKEISNAVNEKVRELKMKRFKHIVHVTLGQQLGAGCRLIARCKWDAECDSQTSDIFSNATIFCVCTVFGIYLY